MSSMSGNFTSVFHSLVFNLVLDGAEPGDVAVQAVHGKSDEFAIEFGELFFHAGKGHEFRSTYRGEVCGVAEKDDP